MFGSPFYAEVYLDKTGREFRWRVKSKANGNVVADSAEGYADERFCAAMVRKVCRVRKVVRVQA